MPAQELKRRSRVFHRFCFIEPLIELKCFLPFSLGLIRYVDASFLPPKQVRTYGHESVRRIPVAHLAHDLIDPKDFLQHNHAWPITAGRQSYMSIALVAIRRLGLDSYFNSCEKLYTRSDVHW